MNKRAFLTLLSAFEVMLTILVIAFVIYDFSRGKAETGIAMLLVALLSTWTSAELIWMTIKEIKRGD